MTELTLDKEQPDVDITALIKAVKILLMVTALMLSVFMLKWVVVDKLDKYEATESSQITTALRERQLACLATNIYYEAGNQSTKGKLAVAAVTINRVKSPKFPKSVCSVVYQKTGRTCQFSWVCEGKKSVRSAQQYAESKKVAEKVLLSGANHGILGRNVLFYHADYVNPRWNLRRVAKIGDHIFYAG